MSGRGTGRLGDVARPKWFWTGTLLCVAGVLGHLPMYAKLTHRPGQLGLPTGVLLPLLHRRVPQAAYGHWSSIGTVILLSALTTGSMTGIAVLGDGIAACPTLPHLLLAVAIRAAGPAVAVLAAHPAPAPWRRCRRGHLSPHLLPPDSKLPQETGR